MPDPRWTEDTVWAVAQAQYRAWHGPAAASWEDQDPDVVAEYYQGAIESLTALADLGVLIPPGPPDAELATLRSVATVAAEAVELIGRLTLGLHDSHLPELRERYRGLLARLPHPYAAPCTGPDSGPKYCWLHGSCWCESEHHPCGMHPKALVEVPDA